MVEYKQLEPTSLSSLVDKVPTFNGSSLSFFDTSSFVYTLFFMAIVGAAFYEYILVGVYRMAASESGIRKSNETFRRTTLGLAAVFALFLIIFTLNKGLLTGNVGLGELKGEVTSGGSISTNANTGTSGGSGSSSRSCESTEAVISKINSPGGICGGATCGILTGCNYGTYTTLIDQAIGSDNTGGQLRKMIIVTMCKESRANPAAKGTNPNGSYDCGLMQINQSTPCDAAILDPAENIRRGVALMRQKIAASSQTYTNIPPETAPFSAYNCCANGTVPNSQSGDCTTANGFPSSFPKWACPINPGDSVSNMCTVKNYVCELSACMKQL